MKPIPFNGQNVVYAENQKEYEPLPAHRSEDGVVTSCWELDDEDIAHIIKERKLFVQQMTFNSPLQPINILHNVIFLNVEDLNHE